MEKAFKKLLDRHYKPNSINQKSIKSKKTEGVNIENTGNPQKVNEEKSNKNQVNQYNNYEELYDNFQDNPDSLLPFNDRCYLCERIKKLTNDGLSSVSRACLF